MKKLKKTMLCLMTCLMVIIPLNISKIYGAGLSWNDFKPKSSNEIVVGYTSIGSWNNGQFFETVTYERIGYDDSSQTTKFRFRYYITHKGSSGSYIYQKVPVGVFVDDKKVATFTSWIDKHISNKTQMCGEKTVTLKAGTHLVELRDIKDGAITVVNVAKRIPVYLPKYTVKFVDYNGTLLKSQSVGYGGNASPPSNPSRTGYTFTGWNGTYTNVTSNRTITAGYRINTYTVTFNSNGGSAVPSRVVTYGDVVGRPSDPTKANHKFMGWYTSLSFNAAYNFNSAVTSSFTLYARWDERPTIKAEDIVIFEKAYTPEKWKQVRMEDVTASDKEDGNITGKIKVPYDNVDLNNQGEYKVRYEVTDSAGNKFTKEVKVTVISSKPPEENTYKRIRSISKEYVDTLNVKSLWRVNADMSSLLTTTLNKADTNTRSVWKLSAEDIERIKEFNRTHDYSPESNALFLAQFGDLKH